MWRLYPEPIAKKGSKYAKHKYAGAGKYKRQKGALGSLRKKKAISALSLE